MAAARSFTTAEELDADNMRILTTAVEMRQDEIQILDSLAGKYGLNVVLTAIDLCSSDDRYEGQPTLDDLRKYIYSARCAVGCQLALRRLGD